jgi:hypothetical protein
MKQHNNSMKYEYGKKVKEEFYPKISSLLQEELQERKA